MLSNSECNSRGISFVVASKEALKDGVAQYAERLSEALLNEICTSDIKLCTIDFKSFIRSFIQVRTLLAASDILHFQYPMEMWGESINPGVSTLLAYLTVSKHKRAKIIITLHEWKSMHPLRKASLIPLLLVAESIVFVSKMELKAFKSSFLFKIFRNAKEDEVVLPIGVNIDINEVDVDVIDGVRKSITNKNYNDLVIGYFGFIYDWKQPYKMLDLVRLIVKKGIGVKLVIAGDFPDDHKQQKKKFENYIRKYQLQDNLIWYGYIANQVDLSNLLSSCNVIIGLYEDGLSSRRGSFWYVAELGVPMLTTRPLSDEEFDSEARERVSNCELIYVSPAVSAEELSLVIIENFSNYNIPSRIRGVAPSWNQIAQKHLNFYREL